MAARDIVAEHIASMRRNRIDDAIALVAEDVEVHFAERPGGGRDVYARFLREATGRVHESGSPIEFVDVLASGSRVVAIIVLHHPVEGGTVALRRITEFEVADGLIRRIRHYVADIDAAQRVRREYEG